MFGKKQVKFIILPQGKTFSEKQFEEITSTALLEDYQVVGLAEYTSTDRDDLIEGWGEITFHEEEDMLDNYKNFTKDQNCKIRTVFSDDEEGSFQVVCANCGEIEQNDKVNFIY